MTQSIVRVVLLLAMVAMVGGLLPGRVLADEATPVASAEQQAAPMPTPVVGTPLAEANLSCDPAVFPAGAEGITYQPLKNYGFVTPADADDHHLYLTVDTLQPGSCLLFFRGLGGASTFFALAGPVEFIAWSGDDGDPVVTAGNADGATVDVPLGAPVTLNAGDWVTVDRDALYTYRNPGTAAAQIIMAVYEPMGEDEGGCSGGCRAHP